MKLNQTTEMMNSADYKDRFKAEYLQLKIRMEGLKNMLEKYKAMKLYASYLEERAIIEGIDLNISE